MLRFVTDGYLNISGILRRRWDAGWLFVLIAVMIMVLSAAIIHREADYGLAIGFWDTISYRYTWFEELSQGMPGVSRTPVYPLLIGICDVLAGGNAKVGMTFVALVQCGFYLVSVRYLWKLSLIVVPGRKSRRVAMALYVFYPNMALFNWALMTDSLMVSWSTMFLYCLIRAYHTGEWRFSLSAVVWAFLLVGLRPAALYLIVALPLFWTVVVFSKRRFSKPVIVGLAGAAVIAGSVYVYGAWVGSCHHIRSLTIIRAVNDYRDVRDWGWLTAETASVGKAKPHIIEPMCYKLEIAKLCPYWDGFKALPEERLTAQEFEQLVDDAMVSHSQERPYKIYRKFMDASRCSFHAEWYDWCPAYGAILRSLQLKIAHLYWFMALYAAVWLFAMRRSRRFNVVGFTMLMISTGAVAVAVIGSFDDYGRLIFGAVPCLVVMVGQLMSMFTRTSGLANLVPEEL